MKTILLESMLLISPVPAADKRQYFVHLSFNSILQLTNGILSGLQKLPEHFNGTAIFVFSRIPFATWATVFPINLDLEMKDLKLSLLAISALKLFYQIIHWHD